MSHLTHLAHQPFLRALAPAHSMPRPPAPRPRPRPADHARLHLPGRTPAEVFALVCDVDRLPEWNDAIAEVLARPPALTPGAVWKVAMRDGPLRWVSRSTVVEIDPRQHVLVHRSGTDDANPSYAEWRWSVHGVADGAVLEVGWRLHPRTLLRERVLAPYRRRRLRREVPESLARFAIALAAQGPPPPAEPGPVTLLGVWAHPDDEAYLSAALMQRVLAAGGRVVVVTATLGEAGLASLLAEDAKAVRHQELRTALRELGVTELEVLGLPDGSCQDEDDEEVVARLEAVMEVVRPDLVVTFGPDGITGHPDHVAVSRWTIAAWRRSGHGRLRLAAMPHSFARRHRDLHERIGLAVDGAVPSVPDADVVLRVAPTAAERSGKERALAAHRSQTEPLMALIGRRAFRSWYVDEHFRAPTDDDLRWAGVAPVLEEVGA